MSLFQTVTLSTSQYASVRGNHAIELYCLPIPNTVMLAARVNGTPSSTPFAQVSFNTVTAGAYTNVKVGYTVLFSKTSDMRKAYLRTRARVVPTSAILYIDMTSAGVVSGDYVFVIKDVALHRKMPRDVNGVTLLDYDVPFRQLLPIINNLQSAIVMKPVAGNWDIVLAPTAIATTSGATISSWGWDADGGTFQAGSASTQNVTLRYSSEGVYFPRVTVTDSGGRSNYFYIRVGCVPSDYSSLVSMGVTQVTMSGTWGIESTGWNAKISVQDDNAFRTMLDQTELIFFADERYGTSTDPILSNVKFVGRLRNEQTTLTANVESRTDFDVEGLAGQLARLRIVPIAMFNTASPTKVSDAQSLTIWRTIAFILTELTTFTNIASLNFDSTNNDYLVDKAGTNKGDRALGMVESIAETINSYFDFSPRGGTIVARRMDFLTNTERATKLTCANMTNADWRDQITIDFEHGKRIANVTAFGGSYNSTTGDVTVYRAVAPAGAWAEGEKPEDFNRQVLKANTTVAQQRDEMALRTGTQFSVLEPIYDVNVELGGGYNWIQPSVHQRWTITIDANDNQRNVGFGTSDYWLCRSVDIRFNIEEATCTVGASFMREVTPIDARVFVEIAPQEAPFLLPTLPNFAFYNPNLLPSNPNWLYPTSLGGGQPPESDAQPINPTTIVLNQSPYSPPAQADIINATPKAGCRMITLNFRNNATIQPDPNFNTILNKNYQLTINGRARIGGDIAWYVEYDFTLSSHGWTAVPLPSGWFGDNPMANYIAGTGFSWRQFDSTGCWYRGARIERDWGGASYHWTSIDVTHTSVLGGNACAPTLRAVIWESNGSLRTRLTAGTNITQSVVDTHTDDKMQIVIYCAAVGTFGRLRGTTVIKKVRLNGVGTPPPGAIITGYTGELYVDAFYRWDNDNEPVPSLHPALSGLLVDGIIPANLPPYNPNHTYKIPFLGTGNPISLKWGDTDYADNENLLLYVQMCSVDGSAVP